MPTAQASHTVNGPDAAELVADTRLSQGFGILPIGLLTPGQDLERNFYYTNESSQYALFFEEDGNLAVIDANSGERVWTLAGLGVDVNRIARMSFQTDGNLAAYDVSGNWVWSALHIAFAT